MDTANRQGETAQDCYKRGMRQMRVSNWTGAIADFDRAIELDPDFAAAYANRGGARNASGDVEGALADLERALAINPKQPGMKELIRVVKKQSKQKSDTPPAQGEPEPMSAAKVSIPLVRTFFDNDTEWALLCATLMDTHDSLNVPITPVSEQRFSGLSPEQVAHLFRQGASLIFIADRETFADRCHTIVLLDRSVEPSRSLRVTQAALWQVANNLSTGNLAFDEFEQALDERRVFSGF